ncbi:MAG: PEP/pyruvate-binding domain-containing protein [Desulfobulbaceae bacterium]
MIRRAASPHPGAAAPGVLNGIHPHFGVYHELMGFRIREILLVSSVYDAYVMEEDGSLAARIINEYHGLNLSRPPRITRVSTVEQAMGLLDTHRFDLVLAMPHLGVMDCATFISRVRERYADLPIILLAHSVRDVERIGESRAAACIDNAYVWCCDSALLLAIVKSVEDRRNADFDTARAMVRVILYVEDSPLYRSQMLPLLYGEVVRQTQAVLDEGLNDEHRLLKMRARPKILTASSVEEAMDVVGAYPHNIYALLTDVRLPDRKNMLDDGGFLLLERARKIVPDLPALIMSTDPGHRERTLAMDAMFGRKDPETMAGTIHDFFLEYLGFGDFVFRMPDGEEVGRAANLHEFEKMLRNVPDACLEYHARRNHFSHWVMARAEIALASRLSRHHFTRITRVDHLREDIVFKVHALRRLRQKGVVAQFSAATFDPEVMDFVRMGSGSLGGKARGLAFMSGLLFRAATSPTPLAEAGVKVPPTCVVSTQGFEDFVALNGLRSEENRSDEETAAAFLDGELPGWLQEDLRAFLARVTRPLSVRSSSMLEDAQFQPYAGLYSTFMLSNTHPDFEVRFAELATAVRLVFASTWFEGPRTFSRAVGQPGRESMAVILQPIVGRRYGRYLYPAVAGTIQSYNCYSLPPMRPEDGMAAMALGFGKTVVEGERCLRFSPALPESLPQLASTDDMLRNTQRYFYSLDCEAPFSPRSANLVRRDLDEAAAEYPVRLLSSTYFPEENRVRDVDLPGPKVLTFASLLKYGSFPLAETMRDLIELGREGMGCEVEMEFALDLDEDPGKSVFHLLQIRPLASNTEGGEVVIEQGERKRAVCLSTRALGHGVFRDLQDIVYVKPETFEIAKSAEIAAEIGRMNRALAREGRTYVLIGFGRWGSADPWLGIPVRWQDIAAAGAIIEVQGPGVRAEPSQGAHFFHNITSLGIPYLVVDETGESGGEDRVNWKWLAGRPAAGETGFVRHVRLGSPCLLKVNGRGSEAVLLAGA